MNQRPSSRPPLRAPPPSPRLCPRFGAQGEAGARTEPILHPSFENHCWAGPQPTPVLLTEQATLCLCPAHRTCPRLLAAQAVSGGNRTADAAVPMQRTAASQLDPDIDTALEDLAAETEATVSRATRARRQWGWIGAGLIFMSSLMCGGFFAAYIGWQMISSELLAPAPGVVDTVAAAPPAAQPQFYFVVTATSEPLPENQLGAAPQAVDAAQYPAAVTPTPDAFGAAIPLPPGVEALPAVQNPAQMQQPLPQAEPAQIILPPAQPPVLDMQLEIPTRRPTPVLDIPTSTPGPVDGEPGATATPAFVGPPLVLFSAKDSALVAGECTMVSWNVENVRAVYYENLGVDGHGEKRECVRDKPGLYTLAVVFPSGDTRIYTTTVDLIIPTSTPMPTPTFTDVPPATPTWTPEAPTATPTPNVQYGVRLDVSSTTLTCSPGQTCETDLLVTNTGSAIDNLSIQFVEAGPWQARFCRLDGVCSNSVLTLVNMGPGNTGVIRLQITVPDSTPYTESGYRFQASSDGSGKAVQSPVVLLRAVGP
jgi:hypothetical protein